VVRPLRIPSAQVISAVSHLASPKRALDAWASVANRGAVLLVQETEYLVSDTPALVRYYELLAELQRRCGQAMDVGPHVDAALRHGAWRVRVSRVRPLSHDARTMARLHVMNLRTWREDPVAVEAFERAELLRVEDAVAAVADGRIPTQPVRQGLREIVAALG